MTERQLPHCIVCASPASTLLHPSTFHAGLDEAHRYFLANREATAHGDIRRCSGCGFVFTSPQFTPADYDAIYGRVGEAATGTLSGPGAVATRARFARLKRRVAEHADVAAPYLDFGCGNGDFLAEMRSAVGLGFEVGAPGRRPGPGGTSIISGHWPEVAGSSALPFGSQGFVTAFDVFEHLACLDRDIELIHRVLQPRGHLFVTVPDVASLMARVAGARWNMFLLEHLWYFEAGTLDRLMERHGFEALAHSAVPYDAAVSHVVKRLGETVGRRLPQLPQWLEGWVLPIPAGVLFAAYRKRD